MTRITTSRSRIGKPQVRTVTISFVYDNGYGQEWEIEAQVECDAPDSYTMVHANGCDEVSDHVFACIKERAEEIAWEYDQKEPRNKRTGCNCPPYVDGRTAHDADCPLKLRGDEREAYLDLTAKGAETVIAALYVQKNGCYFGLPDVDPWDEARDARLYDGPYPVVAHPPCERWGRYWSGGPSARVRRQKGDDGGCFAAALAAVRKFGGVLEHPEASHAWHHFGLEPPPKRGFWIPADWHGGFTCCVEQGHYGHLARKATWLYAVGIELPELIWGPAVGKMKLDDGYHSKEERARAVKTGVCQRLSQRQRAATPIPFRDVILEMASSTKLRRTA